MTAQSITVTVIVPSVEAIDLANELILAGCGLRADGETLLVSPGPRPLTEAQTSAVRRLKPQLLVLLKITCPKCRRHLDRHQACWKCFRRPCEVCGRDTGSCFIARCALCQEEPAPALPIPPAIAKPSPESEPEPEPMKPARPRRKTAQIAGGLFD